LDQGLLIRVRGKTGWRIRSSAKTASFWSGGRPCRRRMPLITSAMCRSARSSGWPRSRKPRRPWSRVATMREVEIGRGSSETTCPVVALQTWLRLGRIAHGPLFRRITGNGKEAGPDRLTDRHVARLVKRTALAAGVGGTFPKPSGGGSFRDTPCAPASPQPPRPMNATSRGSSATPVPR
jgi:hypothetical protein